LYRLGDGMSDTIDILTRVYAYKRYHAGEEEVKEVSQLDHFDCFPLQIADGTDLIRPEEFEAADVLPRQDKDRVSRCYTRDERGCKCHVNVSVASGQRFHPERD